MIRRVLQRVRRKFFRSVDGKRNGSSFRFCSFLASVPMELLLVTLMGVLLVLIFVLLRLLALVRQL
jgi:hypothetical protein